MLQKNQLVFLESKELRKKNLFKALYVSRCLSNNSELSLLQDCLKMNHYLSCTFLLNYPANKIINIINKKVK